MQRKIVPVILLSVTLLIAFLCGSAVAVEPGDVINAGLFSSLTDIIAGIRGKSAVFLHTEIFNSDRICFAINRICSGQTSALLEWNAINNCPGFPTDKSTVGFWRSTGGGMYAFFFNILQKQEKSPQMVDGDRSYVLLRDERRLHNLSLNSSA